MMQSLERSNRMYWPRPF